MVLATVTAISFSISVLALRELRASRLSANSEPAIVSAEAGAETAIFYRLRGLNSYTNSCPNTVSENLGTGTSFKICNQYYDSPYIFGTSDTNNEVVILNDPANPSNAASGYTSFSVYATSSTNFISLLRLDIYDLDNPGLGPESQPLVTVGNSRTIVLDPAKSYAVFLAPVSPPSGSVSGYIRGFISASEVGIPSKNTKLTSTGSRATLLRKIQIELKK